MQDEYGRTIDYIRISVIDRCNLRCVYCMPEEGIRQVPHSQILTFDEIIRLAGLFSSLGIHKIKITGGEPLVRLGCPQLIGQLKKVPGIDCVTITTNGTLLRQYIPELAKAGIDGINVSLDSLDREEFARITRRDELDHVLEGLESTRAYPQIPVKINCVPMQTDDQMLVRLALLAKDHPIQVRFIEMMPIGLGTSCRMRSQDELIRVFEESFGPLTPVTKKLGNGPGRYYHPDGFAGNIGFISAMTHQFCDQCNRVRLTSEGFLKACLQYNTGTDLRALLRNGSPDSEILDAIRSVILFKPRQHHFGQVSPDAFSPNAASRGASTADSTSVSQEASSIAAKDLRTVWGHDEQRIMSQIGG